ncbi:hypothetical protein phytr_6310 [Candidatus Phycorickettsia trachydisci]|uniref:Uncharacterized protein n=1 Tax=Candidatus Phycorickettsia trachydisci TaxID=2115978 RepID=A0A2P1P8H3_9RICK|nr:hypothetical protein [Candidatus Phycorickettsia trachydisci]AVP87572.1 hypothetical protein phytr_6310 [Candidatus Phycorickettsia trachydisci]
MFRKLLPFINLFFILIIGLGMLPFLRSSIMGLQGDLSNKQSSISKAIEELNQRQKKLEADEEELKKKLEEQIAAQTKKDARRKDKADKDKLIDPTKVSSGSKNNLTLSAIVATGGESYCLINDTILRQGDEISPYKVVLITQDYVLLTDEDENSFKLQLN